MERPVTYTHCVCPDPLLRLIQPLRLELLLTNGTYRIGVVAIVRHRNVLGLGPGWAYGVGGIVGATSAVGVVKIDDFDIANPILTSLY